MSRCIYLRKGEVHTPPVVGIKAGDLPVGQIVKLMEGGVETEFIVVNQGNPDATQYDSSCDGTWLLRKEGGVVQQMNTTQVNGYISSKLNTWFNNDYFNTLGAKEQRVIKQAKIPCSGGTNGSEVLTGTNAPDVKIFALSCYEAGFSNSTSANYMPAEGKKLAYFIEGSGSGATEANTQRIAYKDGTAINWSLRSNYTGNTTQFWYVSDSGTSQRGYGNGSFSIRPALIIPSTSIFDRNTYVLLGGASEPPPPLNIYSAGQSALSNITDFSAEKSEGEYTEISFGSNGLKLVSKYGFAESIVGFKLSSTFISDYKTLVVKVGYTDTKGTPKKAIIGWGNGNYYYNLRYYTPEKYSQNGTTNYAETSFIGADSISSPTEYRIDISTVTSNVADYTIAMAFTGSGDSATTWGCYALITDIHLE